MTKVRVGVIGVGVLGRHHARLYQQCENAELIGVFDRSEDAVKKVADEFSIKAFTSDDELSSEVDALSIAVPTDLHLEVVTKFLNQGKHILVEKPLASHSDQGIKLVELAREKNLILQVGHVEHYNPVITYLSEKMNHPLFIESHRLASFPPPRPGLMPRGTEVGVVHDLMIHDLDLILHLVDSEVISVAAVGMPVLSPTEDIANVRLGFANGCVANITASRISAEQMRKIRVFQPDGYLSLDFGAQEGVIHKRSSTGISQEEVPIESGNALHKELQDFIDCCKNFKDTGNLSEPPVSGARAQKALKLADEIVELIFQHLETSYPDLSEFIK
ncbi:MAG: Gfo/Idh/MocA family oxidoreductase [Lentisphaeria bacterium]|nr:Gfo/Idh/MocA family oxidoreductase [Lentisphaeria bacterium]NQZ66530.1 Gfo/Idh/MocA family oxidoreductase [Lentisphaeria bacterium]